MRVAVIVTGQMRDFKVNVGNHMKHMIEPNGADVFVYACTRNTVHTIGDNITQKYNITSTHTPKEMKEDISSFYGKSLRKITIDENENLDDTDFGTLGYFKRKMNNQMSNVRSGFKMAMEYSKENGFEYDVVVRCRPDNSMFPNPVLLSKVDILEGNIYSTVYPSGHRDPWFFSFSKPTTFDHYCSFVYMDGADESRTDNNFDCPEIALEKYLYDSGKNILLAPSICRPFYEYNKTRPIVDFPFRNDKEKLLDAEGNWVDQVVPTGGE